MYIPTHEEILDLPSVKRNIAEFKRLGYSVPFECTTGSTAFGNGTRKIRMPAWIKERIPDYTLWEYSIYPYKGSVVDNNGYQIKKVAPLKTLEDWDNLLESLFRQKFSPDVLRARKSTSADELEVMYDSKVVGVKGQVAENENSSPDTLRKLWRRFKSEEVFLGLLKNPNCPTDILVDMFKNQESIMSKYYVNDFWLLSRLYKHPNCPIELVLDASWVDFPEARDTAYSQANKLKSEEERNRIFSLITMKEMGILVSKDLPDLSDLDI